MRKIISVILLLSLLLVGCGSLKSYDLGELIPELWDITTQYPNTQKITVTDCASGESVEFTDDGDMSNIRMQLEGIVCIREKEEGTSPMYEIRFQTKSGVTTLEILSEYYYMLDGYRYNAVGNGVDLMFFAGLFN